MIIEFSVENFMSVRTEQTLSFIASPKISHLDKYYTIEANGLKLLKLGLIFGANASGKTNILLAVSALRSLVTSPAREKSDTLKEIVPFAFNTESHNKPTRFSIEFISKKSRYLYKVAVTRQAIVEESLEKYNDSRRSYIFQRETDLDSQVAKIKFGAKFGLKASAKKVLELNTLWNNTVLAGYMKTNIESQELKDVVDWLQKYPRFSISTQPGFPYTTHAVRQGLLSKEHILQILKQADFNISDFTIDEVEEDVPTKIENILREITSTSNTPSDYAFHKMLRIDISVEHEVQGKKYSLPWENESEGTKRYYELSGILLSLVKKPSLALIDELEHSLHPDLFTHFIKAFLVSSADSQLIATTHNREILSNQDIFRNDSIWFTEKNEAAETELYSLNDFGSSVIRNSSSIFNAYKLGKLGATPRLGSYTIEQE